MVWYVSFYLRSVPLTSNPYLMCRFVSGFQASGKSPTFLLKGAKNIFGKIFYATK